MQAKRVKLVHIFTVPDSALFFRGQLRYMWEHGFDVTVICSPGEQLTAFAASENASVLPVAMTRRITPFQDILALGRLCRALLKLRPSIVHTHTPKGGLLGIIAAWICRVPVRIYHIRGLPFMTASGLRRTLLMGTERLACRLAHQVLCVSHSIRDVAIREGICPPVKVKVLGGGSGNGVDAQRLFNRSIQMPDQRGQVRREYGIAPTALVIGFVGRLVRDKGIAELLGAWRTLSTQYPTAHMLVVGPFEGGDAVPDQVRDLLLSDPRIHLTGPVTATALYYDAMDVLVLPSHREGFPNVPLEAAALELPVVATAIPGCTDAVKDGVTGTLVPVHDEVALTVAITTYLDSPELRERHGRAGRQRVLNEFSQELIWSALCNEYLNLRGETTGTSTEAGIT